MKNTTICKLPDTQFTTITKINTGTVLLLILVKVKESSMLTIKINNRTVPVLIPRVNSSYCYVA